MTVVSTIMSLSFPYMLSALIVMLRFPSLKVFSSRFFREMESINVYGISDTRFIIVLSVNVLVILRLGSCGFDLTTGLLPMEHSSSERIEATCLIFPFFPEMGMARASVGCMVSHSLYSGERLMGTCMSVQACCA